MLSMDSILATFIQTQHSRLVDQLEDCTLHTIFALGCNQVLTQPTALKMCSMLHLRVWYRKKEQGSNVHFHNLPGYPSTLPSPHVWS